MTEKEPRRAWAEVEEDRLHEAAAFLRGAGYGHLSTITALDTGTEFEVIYHFWGNGRLLSLKTRVARNEPRIPTITDLFPGAMLYERELHDLFGLAVEGHPDLRPLILPDGWPAGEHPLRKDWHPAEGGDQRG